MSKTRFLASEFEKKNEKSSESNGYLGYYSHMTEFLKEELFPRLEEGKVLVFPTEESARGTAVEYTRAMHKPILSSQCISFDTFSSLFFDTKSGFECASDTSRIFFANWFIDKYSERLRFFCNTDYPEMKDNLPSFIVSLLPSLKEAFSEDLKLSNDVKADLALILSEYEKFLDVNCLYEQNYQESKKTIDVSNYVLISPDSFPKEIKIERRIPYLSVTRLNPKTFDTQLNIYTDEKEEIRATFTSIRSLLDSGVGLEEIALSSSALNRLKPYIELEARLFDIPLAFVQGKTIGDTLPGKFLLNLLALYENDYAISDMKAFFLNPSMPFIHKEDIRIFMEKAVQASIESADKTSPDRYAKLILDGEFSYKAFRRCLDNLSKAKDAEKCQSYFQQLLTLLFDKERFVDTAEDNNVFGFVQDKFKAFLSFVQKSNERGYKIDKPLFSIFVSLIKNSNYVDKDKVQGMRVYPFEQGAATPYRYHYLISLNDSESKSEIKEASFLSQFERDGLGDIDVSENVLKVYLGFSDHVTMSCSRATYQGQMLPLVALMDKQKEVKYELSDSYLEEDSNSRHSDNTLYSLQCIGYERAKNASLRSQKRDEYRTQTSDKLPDLSFSSVNLYQHCHFKYALQKLFGLANLPLYEISNFDALEIGTRMHSVLERFERFGQSENIDELERYFEEEMDVWKNGKRFKFNKETGGEDQINMEAGSAIPSDYMISFIRNRFQGNMKTMIAKIREESTQFPDGLEKFMKAEFPEYGFNLRGIIDKIGISKDGGDLILYDYKTGRAYSGAILAEKRLQFAIYALLLKNAYEEDVKEGKFVFLKDSKFGVGWKPDENQEQDALKCLIDNACEIKNGNWDKTDDWDECSGCEFKGICRRRMAIR